ncbi:uncharacterized protein KY384_009120 [Bacidia gigantensis]|uniref:uncharacterized protein n=1 Tax=Bacidia gigantensis TaxID=2732470 RepID=UPI001D055D71|nr:uncharacterized protein KY384_009120 [Bacidia gigantensis]KAG8525476.1 hypothetical protein KY384_009120 [Bacidia gigantensis]
MEEQNKILRFQYYQAHKAKQAAQHQTANQQSNGVPSNRNPPSALPNGNNPNVPSTAPQLRGAAMEPSSRVGPQPQRLMNGQVNGAIPNYGHNVPSAPMQSQMQMPMGQRGQPQMTSEMRMMQEAQRVQEQQAAYLQQQRQQRNPQQNVQGGSPITHNPNSLPQNSPSLLSSLQDRSSPVNGGQSLPGTSTSPHLNQSQPQALSSGMTPAVNQIQTQVKRRNPSASAEEIQRLTTEQLYRMSQQQSLQQSAMAAAVGNSGGNLGNMQVPSPMMQQQGMLPNGAGNIYNQQQQYAVYMRSQQASQQRSASSGSGMTPGMSASRSTTPMVQRTGSAQGGGPPRGPSQSPRPGPVGIASGQ